MRVLVLLLLALLALPALAVAHADLESVQLLQRVQVSGYEEVRLGEGVWVINATGNVSVGVGVVAVEPPLVLIVFEEGGGLKALVLAQDQQFVVDFPGTVWLRGNGVVTIERVEQGIVLSAPNVRREGGSIVIECGSGWCTGWIYIERGSYVVRYDGGECFHLFAGLRAKAASLIPWGRPLIPLPFIGDKVAPGCTTARVLGAALSLGPGEERPWGAAGGQYFVVMHGGVARLEDLSARLQAQQQEQPPVVQEQPMSEQPMAGMFDLQGLVSNPLPIVLVVLLLLALVLLLRR